jgi:REP element-mobilizing transposase RayT
MPNHPDKGYRLLRCGRWSSPGAEYFLTFCTRDRQPGLSVPDLQDTIWNAFVREASDQSWLVRIATIMPDHVHLLITIDPTTTLSDAVRRFKGRLSPALRTWGLRWQPGYFDHRMRSTEDRLSVFLYIYLNPYRAGLVSIDLRWRGLYCCPADWAWFEPLTVESRPVPGWLR